MCVKLRENIINYVKDHPAVVRGVRRRALKGLADELCAALGLDNKQYHSRVVAEVIGLCEHRGLIIVGGILQVPSAELTHRLGQRQTGMRKRHCRGGKRPRPTKLRVTREEPAPAPALLSEEGLEQLGVALGYAKHAAIRDLMDEQFADWKTQHEPLEGCCGSLDDLVAAGVDERRLYS